MRILPLTILFILLAGTGWWIAQAGPEAFPKKASSVLNENISVNSTENTNVQTTSNVNAEVTVQVPSGLTASNTTTDSITLTWDTVPHMFAYRVLRNNTAVAEIEGQRFLDIGLAAGTTYLYSVMSVDATGRTSAPSPSITAQTAAIATTPTNTNTAIAKPKPAPSPSPTPAPTPTPTPTPTPSAPACGSGGACTPSQVASHSTRSNCWVYLAPINKVYNITAYVANASRHPGGDVIASHCGGNIYNYFIGSLGGHPHSSSALNRTLQAYYIGPLQS